MRQPKQIKELIDCLAKLPGLGPKSATRLALFILKRPAEEARALAAALVAVKEEIRFCSLCHDYTDEDPCSRCQDPKRDKGQLCVVETPADLMVIESSGFYRGLYHVLGGVLSPLSGIGPEELNIKDLLERLALSLNSPDPIREVLIATGSSPEGETTSSFLIDRLKDLPIQVTRLARGLPVGMDLEYVDPLTLRQALEFRREIR
jgi:recombination protein RecR